MNSAGLWEAASEWGRQNGVNLRGWSLSPGPRPGEVIIHNWIITVDQRWVMNGVADIRGVWRALLVEIKIPFGTTVVVNISAGRCDIQVDIPTRRNGDWCACGASMHYAPSDVVKCYGCRLIDRMRAGDEKKFTRPVTSTPTRPPPRAAKPGDKVVTARQIGGFTLDELPIGTSGEILESYQGGYSVLIRRPGRPTLTWTIWANGLTHEDGAPVAS